MKSLCEHRQTLLPLYRRIGYPHPPHLALKASAASGFANPTTNDICDDICFVGTVNATHACHCLVRSLAFSV